jgi:hypothetical protein
MVQLVISCEAAKRDELCPRCGRTMRVDARRCEWCGRRIRKPKREPSPRPLRRSCRHIQYRIWCRICVRSNRHYPQYYGRKRPRRSRNHPLPHVRTLRKRRSAPLHQSVRERAERGRAERTIRILLFHEAMGKLKKLSPRNADRVRAFGNEHYQDYFTRTRFAGREPLSFRAWRRRWWGHLKAAYRRIDVPQLMKALDC